MLSVIVKALFIDWCTHYTYRSGRVPAHCPSLIHVAPADSSVTRKSFHQELANAEGNNRANGAVSNAGDAIRHNSTKRSTARNMKPLLNLYK